MWRYQTILVPEFFISFDFDLSRSISGRGGGENISWWGKKTEIEELRMVTASSPHYIVTRHSDRSTYTCVCCFPPFRTRIHSGCWAGSSLLSPPFLFHFIFLFFNGRRAAERWRQTKNFLRMCRNWKHQRITSLILQGVPFKSSSHPARKDKQFCGNGDRMERRGREGFQENQKFFSTFDLFVMMGVDGICLLTLISVPWPNERFNPKRETRRANRVGDERVGCE